MKDSIEKISCIVVSVACIVGLICLNLIMKNGVFVPIINVILIGTLIAMIIVIFKHSLKELGIIK